MNFTMKGMLAIDSADIELKGITVIAGKNQAGKSSLLNTVAAVMTGNKKLYGATQKDASAVIRKGHKVGSARLSADVGSEGDVPDWSTSLVFPKCEHMENGARPPHNPVTMGMVDPIVDYDAKQWADFVRAISGAGKVSPKMVLEKLDPDQTNPIAKEVMDLLQQGWDVATKACEDRRTEARRDWEKITSEKFGASKANGWKHPDYAQSDVPLDELQARLEQFEAERGRSLAMADVGSQNADELKALIQEQGEEANKITAQLESLAKELDEVRKELSFYPGSDPLSCPCCGVLLELKANTLTEHQAGEYVRRSDAHAKLTDRKGRLEVAIKELTDVKGTLVAQCTANQSVLKRSQSASKGGRAADVVQADITSHQKIIVALMASDRAEDAYRQWKLWDDAVQVVGPNGVRMTATIKALKELNPRLQAMAKMMFPGHEVILQHDQDGNRVALTFDGMPYEALSWNRDPNSFALRIKIIFQLLEAQRLGNEAFIIVDRFDVLQKSHKNGVFKALISSGITALIGQMMNDKPEKDGLKSGGYGRMYWIDDGVVGEV